MGTLELQVDDDVRILKSVLSELQKEAGGYSKLWICGRSQGACLATLLAVAGGGPTVAGAFSIAATALPQLQDIPVGDIYSAPTQKKLSALRLGFYSGEEDLQFTDKRPGDKGGTLPLLKKTLTSFSDVHFWLKQGAGHRHRPEQAVRRRRLQSALRFCAGTGSSKGWRAGRRSLVAAARRAEFSPSRTYSQFSVLGAMYR